MAPELLASLVHRILWVAFAAAPLASAAAEPVTLSGVTFSDERGGFVIKSATGKGTYEEPFVISEEITDPEGAVLTIRGDMARVGNRIGTLHQLGFAITKIVTNNTGEAWSLFELELQDVIPGRRGGQDEVERHRPAGQDRPLPPRDERHAREVQVGDGSGGFHQVRADVHATARRVGR